MTASNTLEFNQAAERGGVTRNYCAHRRLNLPTALEELSASIHADKAIRRIISTWVSRTACCVSCYWRLSCDCSAAETTRVGLAKMRYRRSFRYRRYLRYYRIMNSPKTVMPTILSGLLCFGPLKKEDKVHCLGKLFIHSCTSMEARMDSPLAASNIRPQGSQASKMSHVDKN